MDTILTPVSIWAGFDLSLETRYNVEKKTNDDGVTIEYLTFLGRETGEGRVKIYAALAYKGDAPSRKGLLVLPDSDKGIDEDVMKMFARKDYTVCMPDYRGEGFLSGRFTEYPSNVAYANKATCGRHKDYVDESADRTCWYEWGGVALYARKLLKEIIQSDDLAVLGIRDGGEITWKILSVADFSCAVVYAAAGWNAYKGFNKFGKEEPTLDDERHRYIGGIDSQAYAPYARCPVLMLCPVNDARFDYDRAFDTFSRINESHIKNSAICFSLLGDGMMSKDSCDDMFLFLDKFVGGRQVFVPRPGEIDIYEDAEHNLVASVKGDEMGTAEKSAVYYAEECLNPVIREWKAAKPCDDGGVPSNFLLDICESTTRVFAICCMRYSSGFTSWTKICSKKISGRFRNSGPRSKLLYSSVNGIDCFTCADVNDAVGGVFALDETDSPRLVEKGKGVYGLYSPAGLRTLRVNSIGYLPGDGDLLKLDVYTDEPGYVTMRVSDGHGEEFNATIWSFGGVWQSEVLESKNFKSTAGASLISFSKAVSFEICRMASPFAINNVMWL